MEITIKTSHIMVIGNPDQYGLFKEMGKMATGKRIQLKSVGVSCTTRAFMKRFEIAMKEDKEPAHRIGEDLLQVYDKAGSEGKDTLDKAFAYLCGKSFSTLLHEASSETKNIQN